MNQAFPHQADILEARFGQRVASRLDLGTAELPHDISERLRVARQQLDTLKPDESLSLDISRAGETRKVALVAARTLVAPNPESLGGMLLPSFARASLLRVAGSAGDRSVSLGTAIESL